RTPAKITTVAENLHVVQGDIFDADSVQSALIGCVAVLSALGHDTMQNVTIYSQAAQNILAAMEVHNVGRLIFLTSANAPDGIARPPFAEELRNGILQDTYTDMRWAEALIMHCKIDWTIVRPVGLTDDPYTGQYIIKLDRPPENAFRIARADV